MATKVYVYPADLAGCGHHRLIWPAEALRGQGHQVEVVPPSERKIEVTLDEHGAALRVGYPADAEVMVFQRLTHRYMAAAIPWLRRRGVAIVVDVDDDLFAIHPRNPAYWALHPRGERPVGDPNGEHPHSWHHLASACKAATLVTVSTPALLPRYAAHGRGRVLPNVLADHYYDVPHRDSEWIGWPASMHSHPDDPQVARVAINRLVHQGVKFRVVGNPADAGPAFGLPSDPPGTGPIELLDWPRAIAAGCGIGIAPLSDTRFNQAKSWLKPLEMSAAGVPWVASPRPEYARLHRLGAGALAKDGGKDWYKTLRRLLDHPLERAELAARGRDVAEQLRLRDHAYRWAEAWEDALEVQRGGVVPAAV